MIVDSSVIIAIARREPGFERLAETVFAAETLAIGAPTLVETGIVLQSRLNIDARAFLERMLADLDIATIPFEEAHWREAVAAFRRYGKGRHPAALNFGDCLTYAVAKLSGEPLLHIGEDFQQTDLQLAPQA